MNMKRKMAKGIERLKRVIWRLLEEEKEYYLYSDVEKAIIYECGYDPRTIKVNLNALKKLGWITISSKRYYISNKDYF